MYDAPRYGQLGKLEYDEIEDALLCHVCGQWKKNLAQHVRLTHHMTADDYREHAGLNRQTRLITPTLRARLSEVTRPLIERLRAEGKLRRWNEDPAKWAVHKAAAVEAIREGLRQEASRHRRQAWTEERREEHRERRRARNVAGLDKATGEAISEGLRRTAGEGQCARCGRSYQRATARQRHCTECQAIVRRDYARKYKRTRQAEFEPWHRPVGDGTMWEVTCPRCGTTFRASSHRVKYCAPCSVEALREQKREWRRAHGEGRRVQS